MLEEGGQRDMYGHLCPDGMGMGDLISKLAAS